MGTLAGGSPDYLFAGIRSASRPLGRPRGPKRTPLGWFTLKGVGRERLADLVVSGPRIETTLLHVQRCARGEVIQRKFRFAARQAVRSHVTRTTRAEFTAARGPSVAVEGPRDRCGKPNATGRRRPKSGPSGSPAIRPSAGSLPAQYLATTTEADGTLPAGRSAAGHKPAELSCPADGSRSVAGRPRSRHPHASQQSRRVPILALTAGVLVRGRRDRRDQQGLPLAEESCGTSRSRRILNLEAAPPFPKRQRDESTRLVSSSDETGVFEIPVLPGPGILAFRASDYRAFPFGVGADRIDGPKDGTPGATCLARHRPDLLLARYNTTSWHRSTLSPARSR